MQGSNDRMRRTAYLVVAGLTTIAVMGTATIIVAQTVDSDATSTPALSIADDTPATSTSSDSATTTSMIATSTPSDMGTTSPNIATSSPPAVSLTCTMAYTSDLYDTTDGHAANGVTVIGTQSWTDCNDGYGHTYEFKITPDEYAALSTPDAQMPRKSTADSSQPVPSYLAPASTDSTTTITDATTTVTTTTDSPIIDDSATTTTADASITNDSATTTPEELAETEITTSSTTPDANSPSSESVATTTATTTTQ